MGRAPRSHEGCRAWAAKAFSRLHIDSYPMPPESADPLDPREVDALLQGQDLRTVAADLFALRDSLQRMHLALEQLASTMTVLSDSAARAAEAQRQADAEVQRPPSAPRGD